MPNAALRFKPDPADLEDGGKAKPDAAAASGAGPAERAGNGAAGAPGGGRPGRGEGGRPGGGTGRGGAGRSGPSRSGEVHVELPTGKLRVVRVKTTLTDGNLTAVGTDGLKEGDEVVLGLATARAAAGAGGGAPRGMGRM